MLITALVAGWRGVRAIVGLVLAFVVLWQYVLPGLIAGEDAVVLALCGSAVIMAVVLYLDIRLMRTRGGRALLALRENPRVASTFGINVRVATLFAFVVSGVFAGLAGAIIASNDTFVSPEVWSFNLALVFVIMTVVGGLRSCGYLMRG